MRRSERLGRWFGAALVLPILAPVVVLLIAALTDRGPDGAVRFSLFPAVLTLYDPLVLDSLTTSLVVAGLVGVVALVVGVPLGRIVARWRFWGRRPLAALVCAPVVIPPLFSALGLRLLMGDENLVPWAPTSLSWREPWNAQIGGVWLAYVWVELASLTPLVVLAVARAIGRIDPAWEEAGLVAAARPKKVWRTLVWPLVRPEARRAAGVVFGLTLFEPGAPLALGLRRTLPGQLFTAAMGADWARAAVLVGVGLIVVGMVRWLARGSRRAMPQPDRALPPRSASWRRTPFLVLALAVWSLLAWLPVVVLGLRPLEPATGAFWPQVTAPILDLAANASLLGVLLASLAVGGAVTGIDLALAWFVTARPRRGVSGWLTRRVLSLWGGIPPLALGVGLLLTGPVLSRLADLLPATHYGLIAAGLRDLGGLIDPYQTPGLALIAGLAVLRLPLLTSQAMSARGRCRSELVEAAMTLGATRRRARWDVARPLLGAGLARGVVRRRARVLRCGPGAGADAGLDVPDRRPDRAPPVRPARGPARRRRRSPSWRFSSIWPRSPSVRGMTRRWMGARFRRADD